MVLSHYHYNDNVAEKPYLVEWNGKIKEIPCLLKT